MDTELRQNPLSRWEHEASGGWIVYRQAVALLCRNERPAALRLLAEAETAFHANEDQEGLWRALAGQAAAHWHAHDAALALARASAALRIATAANDQTGIGVVAWQLTVLTLAQEEYAKAASSLLEIQAALQPSLEGAASEGVAVCAHLCGEIERWRDMQARRLVARQTAARVITTIQRDLAGHLGQALTILHSIWRQGSPIDDIGQLMLLPGAAERQAAPSSTWPTLQARLSRWWQALGGGGHPAEPPRASPPEALRLPPRPALPPQAAIVVEARPTEPPRPPEAGEASPEPRAAAPAPRSGARLAVSCFGPFRVALDDQPIDRWESARSRTVFKYLITRRDTAALKEQLADMFWPHSEPELAKRSLHQAIYCLRQSFKRVDPQLAIVLFSDDYYQLNPEISVWVDSEEFSGAIAQARARSACGDTDAALRAYALAADLARGEFLAEDRYESWAEELRQRYSAMLSEALRCLSANHYARSDYATAILFSQRLLAQESCDEEAHLTLMRCYMAQGLRHLAVRQYQICVTALKGELGLSPSDDLEAFYQQVLALA